MNLAALKAECLIKSKAWLQIDFADNDALLGQMIGRAIEFVESYTLNRLFERNIIKESYLDMVEIYDTPFALVSITDKNAVIIPEANYTEHFNDILVKYDFNVEGKKVITYSTGLTVIPETLYEAINKIVAYNYENRTPSQIIPYEIKEILAPYRRFTWF